MFIGGKSKEIAFPSGVSFKKLTAKGKQTKFINIRIPIIDQNSYHPKKNNTRKRETQFKGKTKQKRNKREDKAIRKKKKKRRKKTIKNREAAI